jgi:hypothetical protein
MPSTDPLIYRFYELVMVNGPEALDFGLLLWAILTFGGALRRRGFQLGVLLNRRH